MSYDETLKDAMKVVDTFYQDTASLLSSLKSVLIDNYGYKEIRDKRVCWENSSSLDLPKQWSPPYLCFFLQSKKENNTYISVTILLKECWNNMVPKDNFYIYGAKFRGVKEPAYLNWLIKDGIDSPDPTKYKREENGSIIEITNEFLYDQCTVIKKPLWDLNNMEEVNNFSEELENL